MEETLCFKAYVVRASTLRPTDLGQVLYVELLNSEGEVMERRLLHVKGVRHTENLNSMICSEAVFMSCVLILDPC